MGLVRDVYNSLENVFTVLLSMVHKEAHIQYSAIYLFIFPWLLFCSIFFALLSVIEIKGAYNFFLRIIWSQRETSSTLEVRFEIQNDLDKLQN